MSRVFLAHEQRFGRAIVVKVLAPELAEGLSAERFEREIRHAASLQHPHIVPVLSAGDAAGLPYYTMPFVEGQSLRHRLDEGGALVLSEAVRILREVATALAYAHSRGLVHRDIKPDNVLLSAGVAMVTDFGIAKAIRAATVSSGEAAGATGLTATGIALGTPAYMAPEQALGDPAADFRADLYSFGVMAYECLSGAPPFAGRSAQALVAANINEPPPPISGKRVRLPDALSVLVMQCLAKDPAARPASASVLVTELDRAAAGLTAGKLRDTLGGFRPRKQAAFRRALAAAAFIAVLTIVVVLAAVRPPARDLPATTLVAVLPFDNQGPDSTAYFADGLSEALGNRLASVPAISVIDRESVREYAHTAKTIRQIGRELGVTYIVRGTVRWANGVGGTREVQVTPALVRVSDATLRGAGEPIVAPLSDIFRLQAEMATQIAAALVPALSAQSRDSLMTRPSDNPEAYDAFLRGKAAEESAKRLNSVTPAFEPAISLYRHAMSLDSNFVAPQARLANLLIDLADLTGDSSRLREGAALAKHLYQLRPHDVEVVEATVDRLRTENRWDEALRLVEAEVKLQPQQPRLLFILMQLRLKRGDLTGTDALLGRALTLSPRSVDLLEAASTVALFRREFNQADDYAKRLLAIDPGDWSAYSTRILASTFGYAGTARALEVLAGAERAIDRPPVNLYLPLAWSGSAGRQRVLQLRFERLAATTAWDSAAYYDAKFIAAAGDRNEALIAAYADSLGRVARAIPPSGIRDKVLPAARAIAASARHDPRTADYLRAADPDSQAAWISPTEAAWILDRIGQPDSAVTFVQRALKRPGLVTRRFLASVDALAHLRMDPTFRAVLADSSLPLLSGAPRWSAARAGGCMRSWRRARRTVNVTSRTRVRPTGGLGGTAAPHHDSWTAAGRLEPRGLARRKAAQSVTPISRDAFTTMTDVRRELPRPIARGTGLNGIKAAAEREP
jgi:serine/threonine-protein kinase